MHRSQVAFAVFVFLFHAFSSSAEGEEMSMQLLPRDDLVRIAGYGEEKLSSVLVMGTLVCEACTKPGSELHASHVAGAKIAVACKRDGNRRRRTSWAHGTTDEYGEFMIDLPSHLHAIPRLEEACIVRILGLPKKSPCHHRILRTMPSRRIRLSSVGNSIRVYTTGTVKLIKHGLRPSINEYCSRKREDGMESTW